MSDINSFKLLAIYHSNDTIVITISKDSKNSVLTRDDTIDGYTLIDATATEAIFSRGDKNYRLKLIKSKESPGVQKSVRYIPKAAEVIPSPTERREKLTRGEIVQGDDVTIIDKSLLDHYGRNMNDIWKNIGIKEVKDGRDIKGFRVNFVKRGSDFSKLGLRRGDIIKSVNGQELNSYNSAFEIYKNMDSIESLTLTIKRGKEEMELNYEIN
jgi:general secretion pathway protein C